MVGMVYGSPRASQAVAPTRGRLVPLATRVQQWLAGRAAEHRAVAEFRTAWRVVRRLQRERSAESNSRAAPIPTWPAGAVRLEEGVETKESLLN
jgi:hypothetical protein